MKKLFTLALVLLFAAPVFAQDFNPMRIYLAPQSGSGTDADPYRSILNDYLSSAEGDDMNETDNPARHISVCFVYTSSLAKLAAISADPRVVTLTPQEVTSQAELKSLLDAPFSNWPVAFRNAAQAGLEANGVSTAWLSGSNTLRDVLRYLFRTNIIAQIADYEANANVKAFLTKALTLTVGELTAAQRNAAKNWMQAKGLAIGWITNQSTVREVVHFIVTNLGIGTLKLIGEQF